MTHSSQPNDPHEHERLALPLEALIRDSGAAVIVLDSNLNVLAANDAATDAVASENIQLTGQPISAILPRGPLEERRAMLEHVLGGGRPIRAVEMLFGRLIASSYRAVADDRSIRTALVILRPVRSSEEFRQLSTDPTVRKPAHHHLGSLGVLTHREFQLLRMIGLGLSTQEMAKALHRSSKTIEFHRMTLGTKLKATNRVDLARIAFERRLTCINDGELEQFLKGCNLPDDDGRDLDAATRLD